MYFHITSQLVQQVAVVVLSLHYQVLPMVVVVFAPLMVDAGVVEMEGPFVR